MKTVFTISIPGSHDELDALLAKPREGHLASSSYVSRDGQACVQFRLGGAGEALALAAQLCSPGPWQVHTGYGIHRRLVGVSPEAPVAG